MIQARVRVGATWADAWILNLSSRGMLVQAGRAPERGNYLEIRRGRHVVVARVVWSQDRHFGVHTQDLVHADELIREADNSSALGRPGDGKSERRSQPRQIASRHEASRRRGRVFEFGTLALLGMASAFLLFTTVGELLGRPFGTLEAALTLRKAG